MHFHVFFFFSALEAGTFAVMQSAGGPRDCRKTRQVKRREEKRREEKRREERRGEERRGEERRGE